jgi:hypothetical protein
MRRVSLFVAVVLCLATLATAQTKESIVPAGTLLRCTLDEPAFSSRTAQVGDPVLCHVGSLGLFGRPVFPRGAYLSGRFEDFRDPGHFFGKGWLKLEFNSLTVPGGTFPLSTKVISVSHYKVDAEGRIRGRGHPRRDAVGWMIPPLWPIKVITLPMRGPRPILKGETRMSLRLLDDLYVPTVAAVTSSGSLSAQAPGKNPASISSRIFPRLLYGGTSKPAAEARLPLTPLLSPEEQASITEPARPAESLRSAARPTLLVLKDRRGYVVNEYWFEAGHLVYVGSDGNLQVIPLDDLDLQMTAQLNWERGVPFVLRPKATEP